MAQSARERAVEGWLWNENVQPDEHPDCWYSYPLVGSDHRLEVHLAQAVGGSEVSVRVAGTSNPELLLRADTLMEAFATRLVA
ncbi:hypothetical protein ACFUTV_01035 [Streptomyces sp. NPDC057298]|uniref:hypothetical protein n=1 Tax=Streptomyces sp. NPDC057298 TaxID=3346091 RepID=UPI003634429A